MSDFIQFASERGLIINSLVYGKWARVPTVDHPHKRNGAYFFAGDYAHVQNWAIMESVETWQDNKPRTQFEQRDMSRRMEESKIAAAKERQERQQEACKKARWILGQCELDKHAYLDAKGFKDLCGNVWRKEGQDPLLVIPMRLGQDLHGVQLISIDGSKKFLTGQRTNDTSHIFDGGGKDYLCEGYATGLSLKAALTALKRPYRIHVCFSAGNMLRIAKTLPGARIVADNDASGTGEKVAIESGCKWWMPEKVGFDFNDLHQDLGLFLVTQILRNVLQ